VFGITNVFAPVPAVFDTVTLIFAPIAAILAPIEDILDSILPLALFRHRALRQNRCSHQKAERRRARRC
jgi:hypothetical protein